jgi:hypothetical protein
VSQQESRTKRALIKFFKWFPEAIVLPLHGVVLLIRFIMKVAH